MQLKPDRATLTGGEVSAERGRVRVWAGEGRVLRDGGSERVRGGVRGCGERARAQGSGYFQRARGEGRGYFHRARAPASAEQHLPSPLESRRSQWASFGLRDAQMGADGRRWAGGRRRQSKGGDTGDYTLSGCAGRLALLLSGRQGHAAERIGCSVRGGRARAPSFWSLACGESATRVG